MAQAGAITAINAPILGTLNIIQSVQQQVNMMSYTAINQTINYIRDLSREGAGAVRDTVKAGAVTSRGMLQAVSKAWSTVERVGVISLKYFFKVVEKASGSPESVIVAILMYRVVDWGVAISPGSVDDMLKGLKQNIDSLRFELPEVKLPRVDIVSLTKSVNDFYEQVKAGIKNLQPQVTVEEPKWVDIGCGSPPQAYDVLGWMRYGFCKVAEGLINGLVKLGYAIISLGLWIVARLIDFVVLFVDFIKTISTWMIQLGGMVLNAVVTALEIVVNAFIKLGNFIMSVLLEWVVKKPLLFMIDYFIRPVAVFIVNGFNWIKNSMRTVLCEYLKISPFALGFRYAISSSSRESRKGVLRSIFGGLAKGFVGFALTNMLVAMLIPECSMVPRVQASVPMPPSPSELAIARPPMTFTTTMRFSLQVSEEKYVKIPVTYKTRAIYSIKADEKYRAVFPTFNYSTVSAKIQVKEETETATPRIHSSNIYIKVTSVE